MENLLELVKQINKDDENERAIKVLDEFNRRLNSNPQLIKARQFFEQHHNENK
jgi:hypothetical protein